MQRCISNSGLDMPVSFESATVATSSLLAALKVCNSLETLKLIHASATANGLDSDLYVANSLVNKYAKWGSMESAREVFHNMSERSVVSWTSLMLGNVDKGQGQDAVDLFVQMLAEGHIPDCYAFVAVLKACSQLGASRGARKECLKRGMAIHRLVVTSGCDLNQYLASMLVDMYQKCGSLRHARSVFDNNLEHHDVVCWTALIHGHVENGEPNSALELFALMQVVGYVPTALTFVAAIKACGGLSQDGALDRGMCLHVQAACRGSDSNIHVVSTLVDMYRGCGSLGNAQRVFDQIPHPNTVSWTTLMMAYVEEGEANRALDLFVQMWHEVDAQWDAPDALALAAAVKACTSLTSQEGTRQVVKADSLARGMAIHALAGAACSSDVYFCSILIDMYSKCSCMAYAREVFDKTRTADVVCWTALIMGYADNGEGQMALELYLRMRSEGVEPDTLTFVAALKACGMLVAIEAGRKIHEDVCRFSIDKDPLVGSSLVDFYGKCGCIQESRAAFVNMREKPVVAFNSLMAGYSRVGDTHSVLQLFHEMIHENKKPDNVSFLCLLAACSHAGLVEEGIKLFELMRSEYGLVPSVTHYSCMVDLLSRANRLEEALTMVTDMPFKPASAAWMAILAACRKSKDVVVARLAFHSLLDLNEEDEQSNAAFSIVTSIYTSREMVNGQLETAAPVVGHDSYQGKKSL